MTFEGLMPFLDEEIEWRNPEESPIAGVWHGRQGVRDWFAQARESWAEMRPIPEDFIELPDGRVQHEPAGGDRLPLACDHGAQVLLDTNREHRKALRAEDYVPYRRPADGRRPRGRPGFRSSERLGQVEASSAPRERSQAGHESAPAGHDDWRGSLHLAFAGLLTHGQS